MKGGLKWSTEQMMIIFAVSCLADYPLVLLSFSVHLAHVKHAQPDRRPMRCGTFSCLLHTTLMELVASDDHPSNFIEILRYV